MTVNLNDDLQQALEQQGDSPLELIHPKTKKVYFLVPAETYRKLSAGYDGGDLSPDEMLAVAKKALDDPESWGAPGMDDYDEQ
jgi:hypothetical protein